MLQPLLLLATVTAAGNAAAITDTIATATVDGNAADIVAAITMQCNLGHVHGRLAFT